MHIAAATGVAGFTANDNADFAQQIFWTDINNQPINLTGFTAELTIGDSAPPVNIYLTLSSTGMNPAITITANLGLLTIFVPAATMLTQKWTNGVYDLLLTSGGGLATRLLQGTFNIAPGVTNE